MDTTLVTVTILSMGMAAALSVIVWRLLRDERRRSDARVAALAAAARQDEADEPFADAGLPLRDTTVATSAMFVEPARRSPWGNRLAVMGAIALLGTSVVLFAMSATAARGPRAPSRAAPATAAAVDTAVPGLELLSLRDTRTGDALTITGLVHNPLSGSPLARTAVVAYAFDDNGAFLASGRALLDLVTLAPGDDSPFVVAVPVTGTVARYRIGFRGEDGRVIAHVDKRQQGPMAALHAGPGQDHW